MSKSSAYFVISNLNGKHDVKELKTELDTLKGVTSVSVNRDNSRLVVDFNDDDVRQNQIENKIVLLGYEIKDVKNELF